MAKKTPSLFYAIDYHRLWGGLQKTSSALRPDSRYGNEFEDIGNGVFRLQPDEELQEISQRRKEEKESVIYVRKTSPYHFCVSIHRQMPTTVEICTE